MTALPKKETYEKMVIGLLADMHWQSYRYDYDSSGNLWFKGCHKNQYALESDPNWYIWCNVWNIDKLVRTEGPTVGAWNNRTNLSWNRNILPVPQKYDSETELKTLLASVMTQLRIANAYLSILANETITEEDLGNDNQ